MSNNESPKIDHAAQPTLDTFTEQQLAETYIIHLLFRSFRNLQAIIQSPLEAKGHYGIGLAETRLLLAIDKEGTRINNLVQRTGTSRQFASRVVHNLQELGYIQIIPDPEDGRATLVKLEERGWQYFRDMQQVKNTLDTTLTNRMGKERMDDLFATLQDLIKYTDQTSSTWEQGIDSQ